MGLKVRRQYCLWKQIPQGIQALFSLPKFRCSICGNEMETPLRTLCSGAIKS